MTEAQTGSGDTDRAERAGLPPDSGPEQLVLKTSPSLFRGNPFGVIFLVLLPIAITVGLAFIPNAGWRVWTIGGAIAAAVFWGWLRVWWRNYTVAKTREITNKRTIEHRGLLSRSTDEVMHDHVRNIQIDQTFFQRIMGVGKVGISSAGQAGVEIEMRGLPKPDKIREVIDLYRPM
jgi:hypothetical protein